MLTEVGRSSARLRDLGRKLEEEAVVLEEHGYNQIPDELRKVSGRVIEIVDAISAVTRFDRGAQRPPP
jgi:hypothetical protein